MSAYHSHSSSGLWLKLSGQCRWWASKGGADGRALHPSCCHRRARGQPPPEDGDPDADGGRGRCHRRPPHPPGRRHQPPRGAPRRAMRHGCRLQITACTPVLTRPRGRAARYLAPPSARWPTFGNAHPILLSWRQLLSYAGAGRGRPPAAAEAAVHPAALRRRPPPDAGPRPGCGPEHCPWKSPQLASIICEVQAGHVCRDTCVKKSAPGRWRTCGYECCNKSVLPSMQATTTSPRT